MAEADGDGDAERNAMAELEAKTADAKREMAVADALDEIRSRNARIEKAKRDGVDLDGESGLTSKAEEERLRLEREDEEAARRAFAFARVQNALEEEVNEEAVDEAGTAVGESLSGEKGLMSPPPLPTPRSVDQAVVADMPAPSFKRQVKKKKDHAALLGIKKKQPLV